MARHDRFHKERCGPKSYPSRIYYSPPNLFKPGVKKDLPGISRKAGSETMYSRMYGNFPLRIERQGTLLRQFIRRRATGGNAFWHSRNFSVRPLTQEATPDSASAPARRNLRLFRPILPPPNLQARKDEEGESSLPIPLVSSMIHIFSILAFTCLKSTWPDTGSKARCVTALTSQRFFFGSALRGRAGTERRRPNAPTGTRRDAREF